MNEPLTGLQRQACAALSVEDCYYKAAQHDDSLMRMAYALAANTGMFHCCKQRQKKPFNPMLGETYELVTAKCRFLAEKVEH